MAIKEFAGAAGADGISVRLLSLTPERTLVRLHLPPVRLDGVAKAVDVHLEFDARSVDALLQRLSELRVQMLPPPQSH